MATSEYYDKYVKYKQKYIDLLHKKSTNFYGFGESGIDIQEVDNDRKKKDVFGDGVDTKKIKLSNVSIYSCSGEKESIYTAERVAELMGTNDLIVTDATSNIGGNTFAFAKLFTHVNGVEIEALHAAMLKTNMEELGVGDKVTVYNDDYTKIYNTLKQDVVFIDPPWGGRDYIKKPSMDIFMSGKNLADLLSPLLNISKMIVLKLPFNFNFNKIFNRLKVNTFVIDKMTEHRNPYYIVFIKK